MNKLQRESNKLREEGFITEKALLKVYADQTRFATKYGDLAQNLAQARQQQMAALAESYRLEEKKARAATQADKDAFQAQLDLNNEIVKGLKETADLKVRSLRQAADEELTVQRKVIKEREALMEAAMEKARRSATEVTTGVADAFKDGLDNISTGSLMPLAKKMAEAMSRVAMRRSAKAGEAGDATGAAKAEGMLAGIGKAMTAVAAVAAVMAGLFAVVKLMLDADKAVKDFNKSLLTGIGSAQFGGSVRDLKTNMVSLREEFVHNVGNLNAMGIKSEEAVSAFHALQEGTDGLGLSFNRLGGDAATSAGKVENMMGYVKSAVAYSRIFGTSYEEMAGKFGSAIEDMGIGLDSIQESFSGINTVAMESGFNVKRFFGQVLQASSGMTMYNLRLEDTAAMLGTLSKTLGSVRANAMFGQLKGESAGKSTLDLVGGLLKSGKEGESRTREVVREDALDQAKTFLESITNMPDSIEKKALEAALGGLKSELENPEGFIKALGTTDSKIKEAIATALEYVGGTGVAKAQKFTNLSTVSLAFKDDSVASLAAAMRSITPHAELLTKQYMMMGVLGKSLQEIEDGDLIGNAVTESMGISPADLASLRQVLRRTRVLDDAFKALAATTGAATATEADKEKTLAEFNAQHASSGVVARMKEDGTVGRYRLHKTDTGGVDEGVTRSDEIGESFDLLARAQMTATRVDAPEAVDRDLLAAEETRDATVSMEDLLGNTTNSILADINEVVSSSLDVLRDTYDFFFSKDKKEDVDKARSAALAVTGDFERSYDPFKADLEKQRDLVKQALKDLSTISPDVANRRGLSSKEELLRQKSDLDQSLAQLRTTMQENRRNVRVAEKSLRSYTSIDQIQNTSSQLTDYSWRISRMKAKYAESVGAESVGGRLSNPLYGAQEIIDAVKEGTKEGIKASEPPNAPVAGVAVSGVPANDLLLQMGQGGVKFAQRIDNQDVGVFAKKGGAIDKAGLGAQAKGGSTINNHFYQDQRAIFMSMKKYMKVMGQV